MGNTYENVDIARESAYGSAERHLDKVFAGAFTRRGFLKFVAPSVVTMLFISLYSIVDGFFVANYVGSTALAALNIVWPIMNVVFAIGIMLSVGGCAIVSIRLGENEKDRADKTFSLICFVGVVFGIILSVVCLSNLENIALFLGATPDMLAYSMDYAKIVCYFMPIMILKMLLENFIRADGRADYSLYISLGGGFVNIILDYLFIGVFHWGVTGAAVATGLGFLSSMVAAMVYFLSRRSVLKMKRAKIKLGVIRNVIVNGSSQMVNELSLGVMTFIFNGVALHYAGSDGVSALTIIMYAQFLLVSFFLGFANGVAPLLSYNYGAKIYDNVRHIIRYAVKVVSVSCLVIFVVAIAAAPLICRGFVTPDNPVYDIALSGLRWFSPVFLFVGFNVFVCAVFTSVNNGKIAALISLCRSFLFVLMWLFILTKSFELTGLWLSLPMAELTTIIISILLFKHYRKVYHY